MKTASEIRKRIKALPEGEPFSSSSLLDLGTRAAVDQALSRLVKAGEIRRLARGLFFRPKINRHIGDIPPSALKVAQAMGETVGATVAVHGAEALQRFGLSTQVPTQPVFYTSGPSRRFKLGETEVVLKHVAPRKLALAGRPAGLALRALWHLGKHGVTSQALEKITTQLEPEELVALKKARSIMPAWMADAFHKFEESPRNG